MPLEHYNPRIGLVEVRIHEPEAVHHIVLEGHHTALEEHHTVLVAAGYTELDRVVAHMMRPVGDKASRPWAADRILDLLAVLPVVPGCSLVVRKAVEEGSRLAVAGMESLEID